MEYVDNDGTRIAYQVCGRGEPLVLIHGWSNEGRYWDEFHRPSPNSRTERDRCNSLQGRGRGELCAHRGRKDESPHLNRPSSPKAGRPRPKPPP